MRIVTGPILGRSTSSSVRVWLEWEPNTEPPVLVSHGRRFEVDRIRSHPAAGVYEITGLWTDTEYGFAFEPEDPGRKGPWSFRTLPSRPGRGAIAIVSCNRSQLYRAEPELGDRLWRDLREQIDPLEIQAVLHVGDQVYADGVWDTIASAHLERITRRVMSRSAIEQWCDENQAAWLESYRDLYRQAWHPDRAIAGVLSSVPNLMMWDDHDVHDGFGSRETDKWLPYRRIAEAARTAYLEYQHALNPKEPGPQGLATPWQWSLPEMRLFALDLRGDRDYNTNPSRIVGSAQWRALRAWAETATSTWPPLTCIVTSTPPILFGNTDAAPFVIVPDLIEDLRDQWIHGGNRLELAKLLDFCYEIAVTRQTNVILLSGDIHVHHLVECRERATAQHAFWQITSSPIGSQPVTGLLRRIIYDHAILGGPTHRGSRFDGQIIPETLRDQRGYALLRWEPDGTGGVSASVQWRLLYEDKVLPTPSLDLPTTSAAVEGRRDPWGGRRGQS
jgi:phosphodiesterase/alkaline phosphatase D-like protein